MRKVYKLDGELCANCAGKIKDAVEKMFPGTEVKKVNTMNVSGKTKRRGRTSGETAARKKAMVWLTEESADIEIFEGL